MKCKSVTGSIGIALTALCATTIGAQTIPDRTNLPIHEPKYPHSTVLDARNATAPRQSKEVAQ